MVETGTAAGTLEQAQAARARLAQKLDCPPWAHTLIGALFAVLVADMAAPEPLILPIEGAVALVGVAIFFWFRRRMGFFVNGYRKGRTRPIAFGLVGAYLVCFSLAFWCRTELKLFWPAYALAVVMFGIGTWASVAWNRTYRAELTGSPGGGLGDAA